MNTILDMKYTSEDEVDDSDFTTGDCSETDDDFTESDESDDESGLKVEIMSEEEFTKVIAADVHRLSGVVEEYREYVKSDVEPMDTS